MFVGRKEELRALEELYASRKSELVVIYGRRRIGKSSLVDRFARGKPGLRIEGVEGERTRGQLRHVTGLLRRQAGDAVLASADFKSWEAVLSYLTERVVRRGGPRRKRIIFFDELQWLAAGRRKLVGLLKYYWDNHWKRENVMLILCGSIASFMVRKVLSSEALYGRITFELLLKGLKPDEAARFFGRKRSKEEILKYLLVFGGVPKYLEEVDPAKPFARNINRLCFSPGGPMVREIERIFYSQFREPGTYLRIVNLLKGRMCSFEEIGRAAGIPSGGGLKMYLDNLEAAEIVRSFLPFHKAAGARLRKYTLSDEYLRFYFKYIQPNRRAIGDGRSPRLFERLTHKSLDSWLGFAFELFCLKHSAHLARIMGFEADMLFASPHFAKGDKGFQIDLVYRRSDKTVTVCEVKHQSVEVGTKVIPEMEKKCARLALPRGCSLEKALISLYGPDRALRDSEYFDHCVTLDDILAPEPG